MTRALVIIDVQNDFLEGGSLAVPEGNAVIPLINALRQRSFAQTVYTVDWHPASHVSFAANHQQAPFTQAEIDGRQHTLWPVHCVAGTKGAALHQDLVTLESDMRVEKGTDERFESYSGVQDVAGNSTGLAEKLKAQGIVHVYCCGLATDYCVKETALDFKAKGFATSVVTDCIRGVAPETTEAALKALEEAGVELVCSGDIA